MIEEIKEKIQNTLKKYFTLYNISIIVATIVIIISLIIIFKPERKKEEQQTGEIKVIETKAKENEEITEEKAKEIAKKQFKELGEKIEEEKLEIKKIQRQGKEYYYIKSPKNTIEIKIIGGEITRINSASVK